MAEAFLKVLIQDLSSLIHREIGVIMGVDKEMKKLASTLTTIHAVIGDAEDKQLQGEPIQNWLSKLNEIAYEIEDILDECATEVSKMEHKGSKFNLKKILLRHKFGRRMKEMAEKLDAVAAERHNFHLHAPDVIQSRKFDATRETGSILKEPDHIYGRDEDKEKVVDILVNQVADSRQLSVLPIIGMGGLGKTTLAQLVFNDQRVSHHFETKLWVCVSDNFDLKILLEAVVASAFGSAPDLVPLDVLERRVREVLSQKRYLLILDDVWNDKQENWAMLKSILACGKKGASVVVTTRQKKVADIMETLPAHCLKGLSDEHCWWLFRLRAFGQEKEKHPNLETIGRQIVKKCAGVPLVAKALGGLLRFNRKENEWVHVKESEIWNLSEEETSILPALRLSYYHLPLVLKRCFVYCAVFPKDSIMEKQDLIFRWMAHGCISSNKTRDVEDVGDQIWNELVLRSFFQEVGTRFGRTTFKMHDLLHDLAQSIMENKMPRAKTESSSLSASNSKIREVRLSNYFMTRLSSISLQVTSLTAIMNYNRLRILKLNGARIEELPDSVGKLKHLRCLDLESSFIRTLPRTFCGLWNLQILILNFCGDLKSLPKHITDMINLRHIFLDGCYGLSDMPSRIGKLTFLRTLSLLIVGQKKGNHLDELEHLSLEGRLHIKHLERIQNPMDAKKANLIKKPNLRDLCLCWEGDDTSELAKKMDEEVLEALEPHPDLETLEISGFKSGYFPLWTTKMENVTKITIRNCPNCALLPPLGDLPGLKYLRLQNLAVLEYVIGDEIRGQNSTLAKFPSLEDLSLDGLPNLKGLSKEELGELMFPNLRNLDIEECKLLILPPLSTIEKLTVGKCSLLTLSSFSKLENLSSLSVDFDENDTTTCIPEDAYVEGLCNLKKLTISEAWKHRLPEKWFRGLKSLTELEIKDCNIGSCFPEGWLGHLTALEELRIADCGELEELPEEIKYLHLLKHLELEDLDNLLSLPQGLQHLSSLQSLQLYCLPQLTSLPDGLGNLTSLQSLELHELSQMTSLPDWLGNLTSLTELEIEGCPGVPSLPSSIQGMTNLRYLSISGCPQLQKRCEKGKGGDWHNIAHIPQLYILS